jgi:hypothetical protein
MNDVCKDMAYCVLVMIMIIMVMVVSIAVVMMVNAGIVVLMRDNAVRQR